MNTLSILIALASSSPAAALPAAAAPNAACASDDRGQPGARRAPWLAAAPDEVAAARDGTVRDARPPRTIVGAPCFREPDDDAIEARPEPIALGRRVDAKRRALAARQARLRQRWVDEGTPTPGQAGSESARVLDQAETDHAVTSSAWRAAKTGTAVTVAMLAAGALTGPVAPIAAVLSSAMTTESLIAEDVGAADRERIIQGAALLHVGITAVSVLATGATLLGTGALASRNTENAGLIAGVGTASSLAILATAPLAGGLSTGALTFLFALDDGERPDESIEHVWVDKEKAALAPPAVRR